MMQTRGNVSQFQFLFDLHENFDAFLHCGDGNRAHFRVELSLNNLRTEFWSPSGVESKKLTVFREWSEQTSSGKRLSLLKWRLYLLSVARAKRKNVNRRVTFSLRVNLSVLSVLRANINRRVTFSLKVKLAVFKSL